MCGIHCVGRQRRKPSVSEVFEIAGAILVSVGGATAILFGFSSWLGKVWATRILDRERSKYSEQLEAIKHRLELQLHSGKQVFDAEFAIYREVWAAASQLCAVTIGIRSGLAPSTLTEEEHKERYRQLQDALRTFELFVDSNKPFFAPEIYEALSRLQSLASAENKRAMTNRGLSGIDLGRDHMDGVVPVIEATEDVCRLIRARLFLDLAPNNTFQPTASGGG
jgi:hypothetical protein